MRSAIEYYSRIAAPDSARGFCYLLAETGREISRIRPGGRFSNAPHTKQQERILHTLPERLPIIMLFRQKGDEAKGGWRDAPFWWPVLFPPLGSAPAIFAASAEEAADSDEEEEGGSADSEGAA
jgi:hypothetical protein